MVTGKPTGNQVAFFIVAAWLLAVPVTYYVERTLGAAPPTRDWLERYFHIVLVGIGLLAIPPLRRASMDALRRPIEPRFRKELAAVALSAPLVPFAFAGAYALWFIALDSPLGLEQRLAAMGPADKVLAAAMRPDAIAIQLVVAVLLGPVVEELVFRAFLYRAWAERHGWIIGMLLSAALFGLMHPFFFPAFLGSLVNTCIYRRTASLWAAIVVHATHNLLVYYAVLGRFIFPLDLPFPGDLSSWTWHLSALGLMAIALPLYLWSARETSEAVQEFEFDHVALPR